MNGQKMDNGYDDGIKKEIKMGKTDIFKMEAKTDKNTDMKTFKKYMKTGINIILCSFLSFFMPFLSDYMSIRLFLF
jgi:hypothetical protein